MNNKRESENAGADLSQPTVLPKSEFEKAVAELQQPTILREFWDFLRYNKKWWLLPLIVVLLMITVLVWLSGSFIAPFIYPLF
jgi:hypothetical protein